MTFAEQLRPYYPEPTEAQQAEVMERELNPSQVRTLAAIWREAWQNASGHDLKGGGERYEVKRWELKQLSERVMSVIIEIGLKDDEGTYAEIFSRTRAHVFVGPRGGVTWLRRGGAWAGGKRDLWRVFYDQKARWS